MAEPTIDEMLKVLDEVPETYLNDKEIEAIRAILEQHRAMFGPVDVDVEKAEETRALLLNTVEDFKQSQIRIVRAFVERVKKRAADMAESGGYTNSDLARMILGVSAMQDELATMEKANEQ